MEKKKRYKVYKIIMLIVLTAFVTFLITSVCLCQYFTKGKIGKSLVFSEESMDTTLSRYKNIIDKYFLGEVDEKKLKEGAIKGYIEALDDPYTEYISKDDMKDYLEDTMGNFVGIGIYMVKDTTNNRILVLSPIKNSPAEKAGILPNDAIIEVDGKECTGDDFSTISNQIKGEEGSTVKIKILRENETKEFEIKREKITINPIESKVLKNNIGYIEFSSFDENTSEEFKTQYNDLKAKGIKYLIIDLRNNGGGIVSEALKIADYATNKGDILLYEVDKNNNETIKKSQNDPIIDVPIIILTNKNTASASEILAGCLKDLGKAKTVGTKTYGKGVIQDVLTLQDGSGIKITSEEYLTPNRTKIHKVGIEPDEEVQLPETLENMLEIEEKDDTQLQKAIEMCK